MDIPTTLREEIPFRQRPGMKPLDPDTQALARELERGVRGEVRFDDGSRGLYSTDGSNYRQVPLGVVIPRDADDVLATLAACRRHRAPVLPRGGGTSLAGQCCNIAVVVDFSKYMHRIVEIDPERRLARVEPGVILDHLRVAAERHHLTFAPDPSTHDHCVIGGMIGNNSCGVHSVMGGKTDDNVEELDVVTYDGLRLRVGKTSDQELEAILRQGGRRAQIYAGLKALRDRYAGEIRRRYPKIPRRVSGYNLSYLLPENGFDVAKALVGTEGTCVTILEATVRLVPSPPKRTLLVLGYPTVFDAASHVMEILQAGPIGLEGLDDVLVGDMKKKKLHPEDVQLLPPGNGWLLVEFGADSKDESDAQARRLMDELNKSSNAPSMKLYDDIAEERMVWKVRESGLGATAHVPGEPDTWEGWEDSSVPPERLSEYLHDLRGLLNAYGYKGALYGHFGQGCVHTRIDFDLVTHAGIDRFRSFLDRASDLVIKYGGSLSGEHGDGQSRAELLPKMFGPSLVQAFGELKAIWDPRGKMNPHKIVDPYRITENLRLGTDYRPPKVGTHFRYVEDHGSFANATLRCVGVGTCRRTEGGTMCPSYMVTREEKHSTRGRARMLFEMLEGEPVRGGWKDESVKDALDLCLSCKGCKGDCPVNVDMATYKAEFLSHYYEGRLRPRSAYAMGLVFWWARLASGAPRLANFVSQTRPFSTLAKALGGIAPQRQMPAFAPETFKRWFARRPPTSSRRAVERVLLWPDTFNNYFHPDTAKAAVEVLEAAGCEVVVPKPFLCCGRPLYDYGFLDLAKGRLKHILRTLRPEIERGTPIVGLEPSCLAVFRDELANLFPDDPLARRLSKQSVTFGEYLAGRRDFRMPQLARKAVVHGHCHHRAIMKLSAETKVLSALGLDYQLLDSGCCGMAGSFGFERGEHYDVAMKAGERVLLPAVRYAPGDALVIADGFSCREQIEQATPRRALHVAQVVQMALREGPKGPLAIFPERGYLPQGPAMPSKRSIVATALGLVAFAVGSWAFWTRRRR